MFFRRNFALKWILWIYRFKKFAFHFSLRFWHDVDVGVFCRLHLTNGWKEIHSYSSRNLCTFTLTLKDQFYCLRTSTYFQISIFKPKWLKHIYRIEQDACIYYTNVILYSPTKLLHFFGWKTNLSYMTFNPETKMYRQQRQ